MPDPAAPITLSPTPADGLWSVDERSLDLFARQLGAPPAPRAWYELRREAEHVALVPGFDRLITLGGHAIKELPHQIDVAQRVLRQMGGRAILADEVGLGKTIEASIIYRELAIRGLARRTLILTPASLVGQWQRELYNLITLLRPGQLGTWEEFRAAHLVGGDRRQPKDPEALRALTHAVMIRTRRASVVDDLDLPPRRPRHPEVKLTKAEADLYERTTQFLRRLYREGFVQHEEDEDEAEDGRPRRRTGRGMVQLAMIHLRQRLCSSSQALAESLAHLDEGERIKPQHRIIARQLAERASKVKTHAKLNVLTKILKETPDRVVVFSDHRPTIELIEQRVKALGRTPIVYWGALTTPERDKRIRAFHDDERSVLIATRAGSEGRNLQI